MPIKLLAIGDMHLGRRPSRLPRELANQVNEFSPQKGWERTVEQAIKNQVDLVVLAGDLVDQADNFFEAFRPLEIGINAMVGAGIEVVGISGNHDVSVLPRLAQQLSQFKLLGANGHWETHHFEKQGESVTLHGWSYPRPVVSDSPLEGHVFERAPGLNLGLLHCDRDQADSRYAPVTSQALRQAGLDGWLLGHIHKPDPLSAKSLSGYLGSITGLHVGELGPRGPWLLEIDQGRVQAVTHWTLAPLVWTQLTLNLSTLTEPDQAMNVLMEDIRRLDQEVSAYLQPPQALGIRLFLSGQSDLGDAVLKELIDKQHDNLSVGDIQTIFLESITDHTTAAIDINLLAQRADHIGRLARSLVLLEEPAQGADQSLKTIKQRQTLIQTASEQLMALANEGRWQQIQDSPMTETDVLAYIKNSGHQLLREWLWQAEEWAS